MRLARTTSPQFRALRRQGSYCASMSLATSLTYGSFIVCTFYGQADATSEREVEAELNQPIVNRVCPLNDFIHLRLCDLIGFHPGLAVPLWRLLGGFQMCDLDGVRGF